MEHPLIGNLGEVTTEDIATKISDLQKKLGIAIRTGNGHLVNQVQMALETYQNVYQQRLRESYKTDNNGIDFDKKINIE